MARPSSSQWRRRARRVIDEALARLPAGHTIEDARRALRAVYPFGTREHHPYRMWCIEQREALSRYLKPPVAQDRCGIRMTTREGRPWLDVVCNRHHTRLQSLLTDPERIAIWRACWSGQSEKDAALARLALLDWYRERLDWACDMDVAE